MGEKETATGEEAAVVKTKTKSNQSNDRTDQSGDDEGEAGITNAPSDAARQSSGPRTAQQGFRQGGGDDDSPAAAINNTKSNIKGQAVGGGAGTERQWAIDTTAPETAIGDLDADGPAEAAINNSHSNIKNLRDSSGGGGPSGIAIGDPGVNDNLAGSASPDERS